MVNERKILKVPVLNVVLGCFIVGKIGVEVVMVTFVAATGNSCFAVRSLKMFLTMSRLV